MPPRLREVARKLAGEGIRLERPRSGSHWKFVDAGGKVYPVPAHNGERSELARVYLRGLCRCYGLPERFFDV